MKIKEREKDGGILRFCEIAENDLENEGDRDTNSILYIKNGSQRREKETGVIGNQKNRDHTNHGIVTRGLDTQNSPEDQRRLLSLRFK